jgi:hypothetical protein
MERARVVAEDVWSKMFDSFSGAEVRQLQRLLERCLGGLERQVVELRAAKSAKAATKKKKARRRG